MIIVKRYSNGCCFIHLPAPKYNYLFFQETTKDFTRNSFPSMICKKWLPQEGQASYKFSKANIAPQSTHSAFPFIRFIFFTAPSNIVCFTASCQAKSNAYISIVAKQPMSISISSIIVALPFLASFSAISIMLITMDSSCTISYLLFDVCFYSGSA
jgi:hypothetical protein